MKEADKDKLFTITGSVTSSNSYCGGARPTDEMLAQITAERPLPNVTYYIKEGILNDITKNVLMEIKTDNEGKLNFKLPPGDYVIIDAVRRDSVYYHSILKTYSKETESYSAADTACMNQWLNGFLFQFTVKDSDLSNVSWNIHRSCWVDAPCVHYRGPYPP
jgi:hypothetical protein